MWFKDRKEEGEELFLPDVSPIPPEVMDELGGDFTEIARIGNVKVGSVEYLARIPAPAAEFDLGKHPKLVKKLQIEGEQ